MRGAPRWASRSAAITILLLALVTPRAAAQAPSPPGPWVIDARGATSGVPSDTAFYPPISIDTLVPSRGFGGEAGAHVYLFSLGPSRVGLGAAYLRVRGTTPGVTATFTTVAPQVSFNFGTANGWSYLSAGYGQGSITTTADQLTGTATADSGGLASINVGGGARWFLTRHVGVGFDVRWHRLGATPPASLLAASAGFSVH